MSENEENVPKRRFKEFENAEAWEQRNLGKISKLGSSKRIHREDYVETGIPFFRGLEISKLGTSSKLEDVLYISEEYYKDLKDKYGVPQTGDILITAVGTLGNLYLIHDNAPFYFKDGNLIWLSDIQINSQYLDIYLGDGIGKKRVLESAAGSNQKALTMIKLQNVHVLFPSKAEQRKIAIFFLNLDNLITLHQRKLEKMKALKKAYLTDMFPAEGERKPKLRFAGFTDDWEQRELGELTDVYDGTHQTPNYKENGIMFLSVENIKTLRSEKYISEEDFEKDFKIYPQKNDVLMTRIGDIGTTNVVQSDAPKAYYVSLALLKYKELNPYFLKESIYSEAVKKDIWQRTLHIAFPKKINKNEIANVGIIYPKSKDEQGKIGTLFRNLDNLITLHQHKLDKLQNVKKAYLNEMFI